MRKWIPVALIAFAILWFILTNLGSSLALNQLAMRPVLALIQGEIRIPVQLPGGPAAKDEAPIVASQGIQFGYSTLFQLPDGGLVTCRYRFQSVSCDGGWTPERGS